MDGLGAGAPCRLEDPFLVQIALRGRAGADEIRLVGEADVERTAVGLGVDGDRRDPQLAQRAEDADRDLAAVGDENLGEGRHLARILSVR